MPHKRNNNTHHKNITLDFDICTFSLQLKGFAPSLQRERLARSCPRSGQDQFFCDLYAWLSWGIPLLEPTEKNSEDIASELYVFS